MQIGSWYQGNGRCTFTVWAPQLEKIAVHIVSPKEQLIPLERQSQGYWQITLDAEPGTLYFYQMNGETDRPDPASHHQPEGVHGPSCVVDHRFAWTDDQWRNLPLDQMVIYELHVGTFTPEGTLRQLFPVYLNSRNWGLMRLN